MFGAFMSHLVMGKAKGDAAAAQEQGAGGKQD
jgi:hypothetical protein